MCGIVGIVVKAQNGFMKKTLDIFEQLLVADTIRGEDSTGVVYVEKDGDFHTFRDAAPAFYNVSSILDSSQMKGSYGYGKALIGHNRAATVGKVEDETSHPFVVDDVFAMVHNGTLRNHTALHNTTVDSEALAKHLEPHFAGKLDKEPFEKAMGEVEGAYAVVGYHQKDHKIVLMRNAERPLVIYEDATMIAWASEGLMLHWILARNGVDVSKGKLETLPIHQVYTINLGTNKSEGVDFVPEKKPIQAVSQTATKAPWVTTPTTKTTTGGVSKNQFKRLLKNLAWSYHTFTIQNFVECNWPKLIEEGETKLQLHGEGFPDTLPFPHNVVAQFDLSEHPFLGKDITAELLDCQAYGRIYDMVFDKTSGEVCVKMDRVVLRKKQSKVYGWDEIRRDLDAAEVNSLLLH